MITPPTSSSKRSITFRKMKDIDHVLLSYTLSSALTEPDPALSLEEHVHHYNSTLLDGLDRFAPEKTRLVSFHRSAPWFTDHLRALKSEGRKIERRFRQTGLTVHKLSFREHQKTYSSALRSTRASYYSTLIDSGHRNPRHLFATINQMSNRFMDFFKKRLKTSGTTSPPTNLTLTLILPPMMAQPLITLLRSLNLSSSALF